MLCDGRMVCGCADPYGKRVLGDARTATVAGIWTGETASRLRQDLNGGGSTFCGDCPLKLPLKRDQTPPQRNLQVGPLPSRLYVECTAACNISCNQACCAPETGITRTRQAGMLDFDLFTPRDRRSGTIARARRFLQLRRGVPPQARGGDVRIHQDEVPAHLSLHEHQRPRAHGRPRAPPGALRDRRGNVLDRRRDAGNLHPVPPARATSTRPSPIYRRGRREAQKRARRALHQLALHPFQLERQRRGDGARTQAGHRHRRGSPLRGRSRTIPRTPTRAASCPARRRSRRSGSRCGTTAASGTRSPAQRPVPPSTSARSCRVCRSSPARGGRCSVRDPRAEPVRTRVSRRRPATVAASCASALSSARPTARSSNATTHGRGCPITSRRAARPTCAIEIPAPEAPGRYSVKFDLVSEGIDWFERCGSPTTTRSLWVR